MDSIEDPYYFITPDSTSYRKSQLIALWKCQLACVTEKTCNLVSPQGNNLATRYTSKNNDDFDEMFTGYTSIIKDWSRSSNQTTCVLSCYPYETPYFFPITGYTYEKDDLKVAIEITLMLGKSLRLEAQTISPHKLHITLYPHIGLGAKRSDRVVEYKEADIKWPKFDLSIVHHYPTVEIGLRSAEFDASRCAWVISKVYTDYLTLSNTTRDANDNTVFANIRLNRVDFKYHVKGRDGGYMGVHFQNTHFIECKWVSECRCGLKYIGCLFENCIMDFTGHHGWLPQSYECCIFKDCQIKIDERNEENLTTHKGIIHQNSKLIIV